MIFGESIRAPHTSACCAGRVAWPRLCGHALVLAALLLLLSGCRPPAPAPASTTDVVECGPLKLTVEATPREVLVGDPLKVEIVVQGPQGYDVRMPAADAFAKVSARETETIDARPGPDGLTWRRTFVIAPLVSGVLEIPPLVVKYGRTEAGTATRPATSPVVESELVSSALKVQVRSALTTQDSPERPRDITGTLLPPAAPPSPWRVGLVVGAIAGAVVGAYAAYRALRRRALRPSPPVLPEIWALRALEELAGEDWFAGGRMREYYYRVTEIIRSYVERKFGLAAPEMTTEEFLATLARDQGALPYDAGRLRDFLEACDFVKYAAFQPRRADAEDVLATARAFVHATAAVLQSDKVIK